MGILISGIFKWCIFKYLFRALIRVNEYSVLYMYNILIKLNWVVTVLQMGVNRI